MKSKSEIKLDQNQKHPSNERVESPRPAQETISSEAMTRPWAVHPQLRRLIVSAADADKSLGGSIDEVRDKTRYAVVIAEASHNPLTTYSHKPTRRQAEANAELIVRAVNAHDVLVGALESVRDCGMLASCEMCRKVARAALARVQRGSDTWDNNA